MTILMNILGDVAGWRNCILVGGDWIRCAFNPDLEAGGHTMPSGGSVSLWSRLWALFLKLCSVWQAVDFLLPVRHRTLGSFSSTKPVSMGPCSLPWWTKPWTVHHNETFSFYELPPSWYLFATTVSPKTLIIMYDILQHNFFMFL